jgi:hypothetical protein
MESGRGGSVKLEGADRRQFAKGLAFQFDPMGAVHEAVEDRVGQRRVTDDVMMPPISIG